MAWWLNAILIGWLSFFNLGLLGATSMDQRAVMQPFSSNSSFSSNENTELFTIVPELTNPAERPIPETKPDQTLSMPWLQEVLTSTEMAVDEDSVDSALNRWLSSVKRLLTEQ